MCGTLHLGESPPFGCHSSSFEVAGAVRIARGGGSGGRFSRSRVRSFGAPNIQALRNCTKYICRYFVASISDHLTNSNDQILSLAGHHNELHSAVLR
jgi:hypothetical protein